MSIQKKIGKFIVEIDGKNISIHGDCNSNFGTIYLHNLERWKNHPKGQEFDWNRPQIIGMNWEYGLVPAVTNWIYSQIELMLTQVNLTNDAENFLETLLWVASGNEKETRDEDGKSPEDGELYEKTIYDFSDKFKIAVCDFCWNVKDEMLEIEGVEDELEKCSRSFGGNLFFSLTGHGCGFFDETDADAEKIESALFSFVDKYQLEDLEHMLCVDEETGKIDLCFTPEAIEKYREKYFNVRETETDNETVLA